MLHWWQHNHILLFVIGMLCPNVGSMLLMMWKFVVGWKKFPSMMYNFLFRRLLLGQKKLEKVDKIGIKLAKMPLFALGSWKFYWKLSLHIKLFFSKRPWDKKMPSIFVTHNKPLPYKEKFEVMNMVVAQVNELLFPMAIQCVLNESLGYCLLFDKKFTTISKCCMMHNTNIHANESCRRVFYIFLWFF